MVIGENSAAIVNNVSKEFKDLQITLGSKLALAMGANASEESVVSLSDEELYVAELLVIFQKISEDITQCYHRLHAVEEGASHG